MKVVILGATGFIAFPVAQAYARAGHIVYGTTRSAEGAKSLAKEEILPIICDATKQGERKELDKIIKLSDVVIDAIPAKGPDVPFEVFKHVSSLVADRPIGSKVTYIYTGGTWTQSRGFGGLDSWIGDTLPHSGQVSLTTWRWQVEEAVLSSTEVNGTVIRASMLFGRSGSLYGMFVFSAAEAAAKKGEEFEVPGYPESRYSPIHQDDLADLYLRVGERGALCKGQAFMGANQQTEKMTEMLDAVVRVSGAKGWKLRKPNGPLEEAWASTGMYKPTSGAALVGWTPKKMGLTDGMDIYYESFKAHSS